MRVLWEKNVLDAICPFDPTQKVRWLVVDRKRGRGLVAEFESPAAFCFPTVNAWQQPIPSGSEDIMCDLLEYPSLDITHKFYYSNLMSSAQDSVPFQRNGNTSRPRLARYALRNIQQHNLTENNAVLHPHPQAELLMTMPSPLIGEIPTFNSANATKPNRYINAIIDRGLPTFLDGLSKADMLT
jgi:torulene dioxygenase